MSCCFIISLHSVFLRQNFSNKDNFGFSRGFTVYHWAQKKHLGASWYWNDFQWLFKNKWVPVPMNKKIWQISVHLMEGFKCINCTLYFKFLIQSCWTSSYVQNIFSLLQNEVKIWNLFVCVLTVLNSLSARAGTQICYTDQTYILISCMSLC